MGHAHAQALNVPYRVVVIPVARSGIRRHGRKISLDSIKLRHDLVTKSQGFGWRVALMNGRAIAIVVVVGLAIVLAFALRSTNRADAAAGNCYAATAGPSTPTICN